MAGLSLAAADETLARRLKKAQTLIKRGRVVDAASAYTQILADAPDNVEALFNLAVANTRLDRFGDAITCYRAAIAAQPNIAAAHAGLAVALEAYRIDRFGPGTKLRPISDLRAPVDAYRKAYNAVPLLRSCYAPLTELLAIEGRDAEARIARAAASAYPADLPDAMLNLGATLGAPGDLQAALVTHRKALAETPDNWTLSEQDYLASDLKFTDDQLLTPDGNEVMMEWERPIMERCAEIVSHNHGDVLNVGFGMAIIDTAIQRCGVSSHTIIEAHHQVVQRAEAWAADKTGVRIIPSTWQKALGSLEPFDGIYFDTLIPPIVPFLEHAPKILKPGGVFSFFQYFLDLRNFVVMVRDDLEFGIEDLRFESIAQNKYYRMNARDADGQFTAPLFIFRKM